MRHFRRHPLQSCFSVVLLALIAWALWSTGFWLVQRADWSVVSGNLPLFAIGSYPEASRWRPILWLGSLLLLTLFTLAQPLLLRRGIGLNSTILSWSWLLMMPLGLWLLAGGGVLDPVPSRLWGGLVLTLLLTVFSGVIALPLGVLLALGRCSELTTARQLSKIYIDGMRAVPLIAVLFFGQLLLPLFLPVQIEINRLLRAVVAFGLFAAAYVAEDVRGGLQAVPPTQSEAAAALGLGPWQIQRLVILPQALRIAVPALTNQAVGLLQNTSLMAILGLVELLGISQSLLANPAYIGRHLEVYVWLAALYWLLCTAMALMARQFERQDPSNLIATRRS
ncbi:amino acid ABC transporter permease [Synechococcus sp. CS-197]|uniref:amino acid ABC transporter permease n=1 Tax=Synechococcus sp. CS-197 TaxID=2847985 RepID=UPI0002E06310|nr:amino acid ABC transporter permease [Synechococcus sp. CS-197]MCT0250567.1 amino acid ABC transporter permease [Synechococcus sp. CS-197]